MKSLEIIKSFQQQISWADECQVIDLQKLYKDFFIMQHDEHYFAPIYWHEKVFLLDYWFYVGLAQTYVKNETDHFDPSNFCVIWGGVIPPKGIEEINQNMVGSGVTPFWENVKTSLNYANWLHKVSDGVDWGRSFESFCKGDWKVVMEWDK